MVVLIWLQHLLTYQSYLFQHHVNIILFTLRYIFSRMLDYHFTSFRLTRIAALDPTHFDLLDRTPPAIITNPSPFHRIYEIPSHILVISCDFLRDPIASKMQVEDVWVL